MALFQPRVDRVRTLLICHAGVNDVVKANAGNRGSYGRFYTDKSAFAENGNFEWPGASARNYYATWTKPPLLWTRFLLSTRRKSMCIFFSDLSAVKTKERCCLPDNTNKLCKLINQWSTSVVIKNIKFTLSRHAELRTNVINTGRNLQMKFWSATKAVQTWRVHIPPSFPCSNRGVGGVGSACQHINIQEIFELIQDVVQCQFMHINEGPGHTSPA